MTSAFEWMVALRYLRSRRGEGFISVIAGFSLLGITLGVAALIIVMAVMNGFRSELMDKILGLNGHVIVQGYGGKLYDHEKLLIDISKIDGIVEVMPLIDGRALATNRGVATGAVLRGIERFRLQEHKLISKGLVAGSFDDFAGPDAVTMGHRLASQLGLLIGDRVTLISPKGTATPFGTAPRMRAFTLVATFEVGVYDYDNAFIFMPMEEAQIYFKLPELISSFEIYLDDPDRVFEVRAKIVEAVGDSGVVTDWTQMNASLFNALDVERNVMFLILTLIIIVAAFNIISSLIMLVKDKSRDVAIFRTMGASRASIMRIFMIAGSSVGLVGTSLGVILGVLFVENIEAIRHFLESLTGAELWNAEIRFLSEIPAEMDTGEVMTTVFIALGISFLATLPPSWRASRLDPVEVLRYE